MKCPKPDSGISPRLLEAARQGDTRSQAKVGWIYYEGRVVSKDTIAAETWWRKAAEVGNAAAQYALGFNKPNNMDVNEAATWIKKAANNGSYSAQMFLGEMFLWGVVFPRNRIEALKWIMLGSQVKSRWMPKIHAKIIKLLTNHRDRAEAERRADEWSLQHSRKAFDEWS
jgi:hypothetical protein